MPRESDDWLTRRSWRRESNARRSTLLRKRSGMLSTLPERPKETRRRLLARRSWQRREPLRKQLVTQLKLKPLPPRARKKARLKTKLPSKIQPLLVSRRKLPHSRRKRG